LVWIGPVHGLALGYCRLPTQPCVCIGWLENPSESNIFRAAGWTPISKQFIGENLSCESCAIAPPRAWSFREQNINTRVPGENPAEFVSCQYLDDAINVGQLPSAPTSENVYFQRVKDSVDPVWTGTSSNVGKPVTGGGSNRVMVRWDSLAARWRICG
jgi:hypothetical protein